MSYFTGKSNAAASEVQYSLTSKVCESLQDEKNKYNATASTAVAKEQMYYEAGEIFTGAAVESIKEAVQGTYDNYNGGMYDSEYNVIVARKETYEGRGTGGGGSCVAHKM